MKNIILTVFLAGLFAYAQSSAQVQPYQVSGTAGYVDTTKYDTVSVPYVQGTNVKGVITNEDAENDLIVYFAKTDSVKRDVNSYVKIGPGKRLKFSFQGRKIYRYASADSVYTQVIFGDGIDLGSGGSAKVSTANFTDFGIKNLGAGVEGGDYSWDTTANVLAGQIGFTNTDGQLMQSAGVDSSVIENSYVTANSKVNAIVHSFSGDFENDGIPMIVSVRAYAGGFTVRIKNISANAVTVNSVLIIRFWITN